MRLRLTINEQIAAAGAPTSGFDYLRISLAVAVLAWHTLPLTQGEQAAAAFMSGTFGWAVRLVLPMFFALSGFLVAASLERNSLAAFVTFRGLRILPALVVEIALSALLLGPVLTRLPLPEYFADPRFATYFLNVLGLVHYELPGVFVINPYPNVVNGSLWTVPFELECYLILVGFSIFAVIKRPEWLVGAILAGGAFLLAYSHFRGRADFTMEQAVPGRVLILCFLAGVFFYVARARIIYSGWFFLGCVCVSILCLNIPMLYVLSPLPVAYMTVWVGLQNPPRLPLLFSGDYSYGVYLYAFPIQQTLVLLLPDKPWIIFPLSLVAVFCFAAFSWHVIEKRALELKRLLIAARPLPQTQG